MPDCRVRTMRRDEVGLALALAEREGWNPGLHDAHCFADADPDGFLMAEIDGELAGCVSAVRYDEHFGFIGLYIVVPQWRGRGIGLRLWEHAMKRLSGRVIGLDGVPAQQDNYRKSGFMLAWQNVRYAGVARHGMSDAGATSIVPLTSIGFATLCADDRRVFPAPRERFLRSWIAMPDATGLACIDGARLVGWGVIRRCVEGHKIGPLVADTSAIASALHAALVGHVPAGDAVYLDVPLPNTEAVALAESHGMRVVFETARMYTGPAPPCEIERLYGVTTFELG